MKLKAMLNSIKVIEHAYNSGVVVMSLDAFISIFRSRGKNSKIGNVFNFL